MSKLSKREGPDEVEPVRIGRVRYEAVHWGRDLGVEQNGGFIAAYDEPSGERLWILKVYDIHYDPQRERDVQDVFITNLAPNGTDGKLRVEDEEGREYLVEPRSRTVTAL